MLQRFAFLRLAVLASAPLLLPQSSWAALRAIPPEPQSPCTSCVNENFVAYNRCTYVSVDNVNLPCGFPVGGNFALHGSNVASYRFTFSSADADTLEVQAIRLYFRTVDPVDIPQDQHIGAYNVSLCESSTSPTSIGRPSFPALATVTLTPPQIATGAAWYTLPLTPPYPQLQRDSVYHVVIDPLEQATDDANHIELITARGRTLVRFAPTDASGTSLMSPCDQWFGLMLRDDTLPTPDLVLETVVNESYSPIFVLDLADPDTHAAAGMFGQPYDKHVDNVIRGPLQYGQAITVPANMSIDVNYVAFWTRARGCIDPCSDCPSGLQCGDSGCPPPAKDAEDLKFKLYRVQPTLLVVAEGTLNDTGCGVRRGRSHWFGTFFSPPNQPPNAVSLTAGLYYLVLSAPAATDRPCKGWIFSTEESTLPNVSASELPTYLRDQSFPVSSIDSGATFQWMAQSSDAGFMLGHFPSNTSIASLCDHGLSASSCSTEAFARTAHQNEQLSTVGTSIRNIGGIAGKFYVRLLDETCTPSGPYQDTAGSLVGIHVDGGTLPMTWTMGSSDQFGWLEFGHFDAHHDEVMDHREPIEIRVVTPACLPPPPPK